MTSPAAAALQTALAAEHAAVYGYGIAGAHLATVPRRLAAARYPSAMSSRRVSSSLVRITTVSEIVTATSSVG